MKVKLSGNMLRFSGFRGELEVQGDTVKAGIEDLVRTCPDLRPVLLDGHGSFRAAHRLFFNGDMLTPDELELASQPSDEIVILTAIAGG